MLRITQQVVEVLVVNPGEVLPPPRILTVTQQVVEVLIVDPGTPAPPPPPIGLRVTQQVVEVLIVYNPPTLVESNMAHYGTQEAAQAYFAALLHRGLWANSALSDREKALNSATQRINLFRFSGVKSDDDQDNEFPRCVDDVDIGTPTEIEEACYEIAFAYLSGADPDKDLQELTLSSFAFANVKKGYNREYIPEHTLAGVSSSVAWAKIKPYLQDPNTKTFQRV